MQSFHGLKAVAIQSDNSIITLFPWFENRGNSISTKQSSHFCHGLKAVAIQFDNSIITLFPLFENRGNSIQ